MSDLHGHVFNDTDGISRLNGSVSSKVDFKELRVLFAILGKAKQSEEYDKTYLRANIDTCNINKGMMGNFLQTVLRKIMLEHSNYHFGCPVKKGTYYAINVPAVDDKLLPMYIFATSGEYQLELTVRGKLGNMKGMVHVATVKGLFSIELNK